MNMVYDARPFNNNLPLPFRNFMQAIHDELAQLGGHRDPLPSVVKHLAHRAGVLCLDKFYGEDIPDAMILFPPLDPLTAKGIALINKAIEGGDADSMHNLGVCYERGLGVEKNQAEAVKYYRMGAEAGCAEAMYNLSTCLSTGNGVAKNTDEAAMWKARSTESGTELRGRES